MTPRSPVLSLLVLAAACGGAESSWQPLSAEALAQPPRQAQLQRAEAARGALQQQLVSRLGAAMQQGGPVAAIEVCQQEAPEIARRVGAAEGLRIGRTSFKLRNRANAAPAWAAEHVTAPAADHPAEPRYLAGPEGQLGALLPIITQAPCLTCHGAQERIDPSVRTALAALYPEDRATGFEAGDLRGWFWVEVPPSP